MVKALVKCKITSTKNDIIYIETCILKTNNIVIIRTIYITNKKYQIGKDVK